MVLKRNRNVIKYRKPLKPNIALVILIIIILYVVVISWNYFHAEHISIYEVNETSIADDSTMTGFILRDESVVYSEQEGYINFYHADQSKVGKNEVIYTIDKNGTVNFRGFYGEYEVTVDGKTYRVNFDENDKEAVL